MKLLVNSLKKYHFLKFQLKHSLTDHHQLNLPIKFIPQTIHFFPHSPIPPTKFCKNFLINIIVFFNLTFEIIWRSLRQNLKIRFGKISQHHQNLFIIHFHHFFFEFFKN